MIPSPRKIQLTKPNLSQQAAKAGALPARVDDVVSASSKRLRSLELQDVESGVVVGEVHHALRIDKAVCGLDDLRPVGTRVETCALDRAARRTQPRAAGTHSRCQRPGRRKCWKG